MSRSSVIPPTSKVKVVLLSPHIVGTHVPRSVEIVVPGDALKETSEMKTTAGNGKKKKKALV